MKGNVKTPKLYKSKPQKYKNTFLSCQKYLCVQLFCVQRLDNNSILDKMGAGENDGKQSPSCQLVPGGFAGTGPNGSFFETPGWVDKVNKHCEVLVSCSGQKIQKGTNGNLQEPSGTACKLL